MKILHTLLTFNLLISCLLALFALSFSFSPTDNYLVDCGSAVDSTADNRRFVADSSTSSSPLISSSGSISIRSNDHLPGLPQMYHTARVFKQPSNYVFNIGEQGTHIVRFHFNKFNSSKFDFSDAKFHVLVNGYVVLSNFSGDVTSRVRVKEYLIRIDSQKLVVAFIPSDGSKFAFVNGIEVISAPKDLIADAAKFVSSDGVEDFNGLSKEAFEIVHRVNVGGFKVTPFNDTLWRTWVTDDEYLKSIDHSNNVYFSGWIKYQNGGASREVAPDNVYNTARVITSKNSSIPNVNITFEFPVVEGYNYLVRMHFCDIASISLGLLFFNVYVNGFMAYKDLDLSDVTNYALASPFYADFVVDGKQTSVLTVSVGPSSKSLAYTVDGILNGVEVMKMSNPLGSLSGNLSANSILKSWSGGHVNVIVCMIAIMCLGMSIFIALRRRTVNVVESVAWSKLPVDVDVDVDVDVHDDNSKHHPKETSEPF